MVICTLSGGLASAYCAWWTLQNYPKDQVILYFNDTKWEHKDLYRFLNDIEVFLDHKITYDSKGISPEDLFFKERMLGNNRADCCSIRLKAEMLQNYFKNGDTLVFGIGLHERHRAKRISDIYSNLKKDCFVRFPLIENKVTKWDINQFFKDNNIKIPELYRLGFEHNNCSGGCVRAGKKQWSHLLEVLPEVYEQRERLESDFQEFFDNEYTFLKDISLKQLREKIQSNPQIKLSFDDSFDGECIGICSNVF